MTVPLLQKLDWFFGIVAVSPATTRTRCQHFEGIEINARDTGKLSG